MKSIKDIFSKKKPTIRKYDSYADALAACEHEGYEDKELCNLIALKTLHYKEKLQLKPYSINPVHCYLTLTIQHVLLQTGLGKIEVSDFGGGCGAHYFETLRFIEAGKLQWTVIETPEMVKNALSNQLNNDHLHFSSNPKEAKGQLLYLSSSIQYVADPHGMLDLLISRNFPYMLFNRMMLHTSAHEDIITVQQSRLLDNGPGNLTTDIKDRIIKYPHTTLSLKKFIKKMESAYELIFKFEEPSGNIDQKNTQITGGGFLFKRK